MSTGTSGSGTGSSGGGATASNAPAKFVYETTDGQSILGFTFNASTGAMSPVPGSPYALPGTTFATYFTSDANGHFLYIAAQPFNDCHGCNYGIYELMGYLIDQSTGALKAISGLPLNPTYVGHILLTPDGNYLYAELGNSEYTIFSVDQSSGALTQVGTTAQGESGTPVITANGRFLFTTYQAPDATGESLVNAYTLDSNSGVATLVSGSPFHSGSYFPLSLTANSAGTALYIGANYPSSGGNAALSALAVASDGTLSSAPSSPYAVTPKTILNDTVADPLGRFVFLEGQPFSSGSQIFTFVVQGDGSLKQGSSGALGCYSPMATDPAGSFLFNPGTPTPLAYQIGSNGDLTATATTSTCGGGPIVAVP